MFKTSDKREMSPNIKSWRATPSIVVEDVDRRQSRLDNLKYPDKNANTQFKVYDKRSPSRPTLPTSPTAVIHIAAAIIEPDVDAYVTPLSLCHVDSPRTPTAPSAPFSTFHTPDRSPRAPASPGATKAASPHQEASRVAMPSMEADVETSFTSVDIGTGSHHREVSWWSQSAGSNSSSQGSTSCFDVASGLFCASGLAQAVPAGGDHRSPNCKHHRVVLEIDDSHGELQRPKTSLRKRMSRCSLIGIVFLSLAIVSIIAVGIALYVQFVVVKAPLSASLRKASNETNICDLIVDACNNGTDIVTPTLATNSTGEELEQDL